MTSVLFVLSAAHVWTLDDGTQHPTGFWAEEFLVPYELFTAQGWDVTIATPGGARPVVDQISLSVKGGVLPGKAKEYQEQLAELAPLLDHPKVLADVDADSFDLVFYPGGHAPMEDLSHDAVSGAILAGRLESGRPLALLCHAPAAVLAAARPDGTNPFAGRRMTALSNVEEKTNPVSWKASWLLQDRLEEIGVDYSKALLPFRPHVVVDGALYTGQNPQSSQDLAERLIRDLTAPESSAAATPLPALPQDWSRVLCVVAHPDDMEYGASAAVSTWTTAGVEVTYLLLTSGEAGMQRPPEEVGPIRAAEQERACATVGVRDLRILDHPDGMLMPTLDLRRDIARVIRQVRPDVVVTANFDFEAYGGLNQADHRAAGLATVDAVRDADNTWIFRELADAEGLPKWHTRWVLVAGHPDPTHAVAVSSEAVSAAVASLRCHEAYLADLPGHPVPEEFIPAILAQGGQAMGVDHAVLFKAYDLGPAMTSPVDES